MKFYRELRRMKFWRRQEGSAIVLVGLSMVVLLAVAGLLLDTGSVMMRRMQLQKAADAAVLSGAQELTHSPSAVTDVVNQILADHGAASDLVNLGIDMDHKVSVDLHEDDSLAFTGLFGVPSAGVNVHAAAALETMTAARGAAPLGISDSVNLVYGQSYSLKVDQTSEDTGYFGILALGGPGAATYEDNLMHGYGKAIKVGDILDTQTGNVAGDTRDAVQYLLDESPYPDGETWHRDDPRILLVPVYHPYDYSGGQLKQVKIVGFSYFYLEAPMDWSTKAVKGIFIERAGPGAGSPDAAGYGAYAIRLTE